MTTPDQWFILAGFAAVALVVLFGAALAGAGRFGHLPDAVVDEYLPELPDRALRPEDVRSARFAVRPRGYSISQVERLLARAAADWDADRAAAAPQPSVWAFGPDALAESDAGPGPS